MLHSGGYKQQREFAELFRSVPEVRDGSLLCERLLLMTGWGIISATTAQWLAYGAVVDGLAHSDIVKLSNLGKAGTYSGNVRRELIRSFCKDMSLPKPIRRNTFVCDKGNRPLEHEHFVINPLAMIETYYQKYQSVFKQHVLGDGPRKFWDSVDPEDPKLSLLAEMVASPDWKDRLIPFIIHGDGGKFTNKNQNSLMTVSMRSALVPGFHDAILPTFFLAKTCRLRVGNIHGHPDTLDDLFTLFVHLLNAGYSGVHPVRDDRGVCWPDGTFEAMHAGTLFLEGKYKLVFWIGTGDLEYLGNDLRMPHFGSNNPCWFCPASRDDSSPHSITDVRPFASWKAHIIPRLVAITNHCTDHVIMKLNGATRFHFPGDWMHMNCIGVLCYFNGSVIKELVKHGPYIGNVSERRAQLWSRISFWYSELGIINCLTGFHQCLFDEGDKWAYLAAKAADNHHLVYVLEKICQESNDGSEHDAVRLEALKSMRTCHSILATGGMFLQRRRSERLLKSIDKFLMCNNWLLKYSLELGRKYFYIGVKHHLLWHVGYMARYLSPTVSWCYDFENFVGIAVLSAKACVAGTPMHKVGNKVVENYMLVSEIKFKRLKT